MKAQRPLNSFKFVGILCFLTGYSLAVQADNTWSYCQQNDSLTNQSYSVAQSPLPRPGVYDDMTLEIICKNNKLQAIITTDDLIASQGSAFTLQYQIDKNVPVTLTLKTFPDSKRKGYTELEAKRITDDLLTGQTVFIRVNTMIKTVLSSTIALDNIQEPLKQVLSDCDLNSAHTANNELTYSLSQFEQDFNQRSPEHQSQILKGLKQLMTDIK